MSRTILAGGLAVCSLGLFTVACDAGVEAGPDSEVRVEGVADTIVTTMSGTIGSLSDLNVGEGGALYVLDSQTRVVHVIDSTGSVLRTIGRAGQGPGELTAPSSLRLSGDTVAVVDPLNQRIQLYHRAGEPISSREIPDCARGPAPPELGSEETLIMPTVGFQDGLAVVCSGDGEEQTRLGELLAPRQTGVNLGEIHAQIQEGEVPAMFLNAAQVVPAGDGSVWLLLPGAARVKRFTASGDLAMDLTLDEPEFPAVRSAWVERNAGETEMRVAGLNYLLRGREVEGDLWVLTDTAHEGYSRIVVLSSDGEVRTRLRFVGVDGARNFAVDAERGWAYFYIGDTAELVRVELDLQRLNGPA